jgi:2,3-bisphosphoglycerate-dependent phosphoglycerate mutase
MNRPSLLVIARHAQSMRNAVKKGNLYFPDEETREPIKGIPDYKIPLTEKGKKQAIILGKALNNRFGLFDYIYHSGYTRTRQTLDGILSGYAQEEINEMQIRFDPSIRERHPGYTYEMTQEEAESAFPYIADHWSTFGGFFAQPPGGESLADVSIRTLSFLNMIFRKRIGEKVLLVTHGGTIKSFRFNLEDWGYDQILQIPKGQNPRNCGITVYEYSHAEKKLILKEYNTVYD